MEHPGYWQTLNTARRLTVILTALVSVSLIAFTLIGLLLFSRYQPPTVAMEPTVHPGDRIWARAVGVVHRGDVVLIKPPPVAESSNVLLRRPILVISRVVAVGGDRVEATKGRLRVNGRVATEPYLPRSTVTRDIDATRVPKGYLYYLGDNRQNTAGSNAFGPVPSSAVRERVVWIGAPPMGLIVAAAIIFGICDLLWCARRLRLLPKPA